jgi:hypothetical protein
MFWVLVGSILPAGTWNARFERTVESAHFTESEEQQIHNLLTEAQEDQIPVDLLVLRLEEGVAKRVPTSTLYNALELERQAYSYTRDLIVHELGLQEAERIVSDNTIWSRVTTIYRQGVPDEDLKALIAMFNKQRSAERWNNFRYGGGLLIALRQWGLEETLSLQVVEALSRSSIPGEDYRAVIDLFNAGISNRTSLEDIANRIIDSAPNSRSLKVLERMVR